MNTTASNDQPTQRRKRNLEEAQIPPRSRRKRLKGVEARIHSPTEKALRELNNSAQSKDLQRFSRAGGPDLSDLRGYRQSCVEDHRSCTMPKKRESSPTAPTTSTGKSTPYQPNYRQDLIENRIYPHQYIHPDGRMPHRPSNESEIVRRLKQPRSSLSPSKFNDHDFQQYDGQLSRALNEQEVLTDVVVPYIQGRGQQHIYSGKDVKFTNLTPITSYDFSDAKPDLYDGAHPVEIDHTIREGMGRYIVPTKNSGPVLGNFMAEAKGPGGTTGVVANQANYDGAIGARGMDSMWSYGTKTPPEASKAYALTCTFLDGSLQMYTTHSTRTPGDQNHSSRDYHQTRVGAWQLNDSADSFRSGAAAYRNGRDWAKEQRDLAIAYANKQVSSGQKVSASVSKTFKKTDSSTKALPRSKISADESDSGSSSEGAPRRSRKRGGRQKKDDGKSKLPRTKGATRGRGRRER